MAPTMVLVPLDGSDFSRQAVAVVRTVLDPQRHALTLLRVAPPPEGVGVLPPRPLVLDSWILGTGADAPDPHPVFQSQVWDALKADLETRMRPDVEALQDDGFAVRSVVRFGDPAQEIVALAREEGVQLVVMATHGRSGVPRVLMGSVAETVLRSLTIPVMMVRPEEVAVPDAPGF